eukprot:Gb_33508 [translate_table: standard]
MDQALLFFYTINSMFSAQKITSSAPQSLTNLQRRDSFRTTDFSFAISSSLLQNLTVVSLQRPARPSRLFPSWYNKQFEPLENSKIGQLKSPRLKGQERSPR